MSRSRWQTPTPTRPVHDDDGDVAAPLAEHRTACERVSGIRASMHRRDQREHRRPAAVRGIEPRHCHDPESPDRVREGRGNREGVGPDREDGETTRDREGHSVGGGSGKGIGPQAPHDPEQGSARGRWRLTDRRVKNPSEIVVLFKTHLRAGADKEEYAKTSRRMHELVETIPGFISIKGDMGEDGDEIDIARVKTEKP